MEKGTRDMFDESEGCTPYLINFSTIGHLKKGSTPTEKEIIQEAEDFYDEYFPTPQKIIKGLAKYFGIN